VTPRIDIVTPLHNEEQGFSTFVETVERILMSRGDIMFHVILVDDGSTDDTWRLIERQCAASPRYRGLRLSRNFGFHAALAAGFHYADGDAVATLDADLQDPPETVLEFVEAWQRGADVVWGWRRSRDEMRWRIALSEAFAWLARRFAMPEGSKFTTGSFLLVDRAVVESLRQMPEHKRVTFALVAWAGFEQAIIYYDRRRRVIGKTNWSLARLLNTGYDTFVANSEVLPRLVTIVGLSFALVGFGLGGYSLLSWALTSTLPGWAGLMVTLTTFFGVNFLILGLMSEYLLRIHLEAMRRPTFFVKADTTHPTRRTAESERGREPATSGDPSTMPAREVGAGERRLAR
jgi:glycosyltransferase involved in cell wall biosynthesis